MAGSIGNTSDRVASAAGDDPAAAAAPSPIGPAAAGDTLRPTDDVPLAVAALASAGPAPPAADSSSGRAESSPARLDPTRVPRSRPAMAAQLLDRLAREPYELDFFQILRRLECAYPEYPRMGEAQRPIEEPIRLGQEATPVFAPAALSSLRPGRAGGPPWLLVHFMGLLGPNGPLALHLTEYARDRLRNAGDPTFSRFLDVFNHRMLLLFYRAWANSQPTVSQDRPDSNRFFNYVSAAIGLGMPSLRDRDKFPHGARLFYAGLFAAQTRHAAGLTAVIGDFFSMPTKVEEFVGSWLELPMENRWALGQRDPGFLLGMSTTLGAHVWNRQQKFRVVLGPLTRPQFRRMLPGGPGLPKLTSLVRGYVGDELRWDVRLVLDDRTDEPLHLGRSHMGWTTWLGRALGPERDDLILDPQGEAVLAAA